MKIAEANPSAGIQMPHRWLPVFMGAHKDAAP